MNYLDIDKALVDVTRAKCNECRARLDAVPKDKAAERKALQIEYGMYTLCGNAGLQFNIGGAREVLYRKTRQSFWGYAMTKYPRHEAIYATLNDDEKLSFMAAWLAELFMRNQLLDKYVAELARAEAARDAKNIFEFRIKIGAVEKMLSLWEGWRKENGVYPELMEEA